VTPIIAFNFSSFLTSHGGIVLVIGAVFFLLQNVLCVRFYLRMSRHEQRLKRLYGDLKAGGNGRLGIESYALGFPWLSWIHQVFPMGTTTPGNYTRDDVLQELDTRIASSADYLFLQRMGVMAPLLGVILTVLGFAWLEAPQGTEEALDKFDLDSILFAVTPLVAGVGTGAVLAFINQGHIRFVGTPRAFRRSATVRLPPRPSSLSARAARAKGRTIARRPYRTRDSGSPPRPRVRAKRHSH